MKNLILALAVVFGFASVSMADNHEGATEATHEVSKKAVKKEKKALKAKAKGNVAKYERKHKKAVEAAKEHGDDMTKVTEEAQKKIDEEKTKENH